jgi:hypothetical protein
MPTWLVPRLGCAVRGPARAGRLSRFVVRTMVADPVSHRDDAGPAACRSDRAAVNNKFTRFSY